MRCYFNGRHYREFLPGSIALCPNNYEHHHLIVKDEAVASLKFKIFKVLFDAIFAVFGLGLVAVIAVILSVLNPRLNPGPLFFVQERTGLRGRPFRMWKFRTMKPCKTTVRDPNAPVEEGRITPLGRFLRHSRIDELPNLINVVRGEMSVVGPRPEAVSHTTYYSTRVAGYRHRLRVRPGITGLAQVQQGYVQDEDAAAVKAKYDNIYVTRYCGRLDLYIILRTGWVMAFGIGAR